MPLPGKWYETPFFSISARNGAPQVCGILGYSHTQKRIHPDILSGALDSLTHRGPDHQGHFISKEISLGAVRLRILDLESGDQPLFSEDRDVVVVFNGEIFNHHEIRTQLEAEGFKFRTRCDTEVVLNAFLCWGTKCFPRLRGMFAIAIWVQSEGRLILARDRMGIKPLYYCLQDGQIYFGSELKCIFAHPAVQRRISLPGLNCFLSLNYVPGPLTLVHGILKLMPGELLECRGGRSSVRSYLPPSVLQPAPRSVEAACEELDDLLTKSVQEQLVADVPVGIWLSGGLDSSTILRYAAKTHASQLRTFSITFQGRSFDEGKYAREVSRHFGTQHAELDVNPSTDLVHATERIAYYSDEPSADAGALPLWFLAELTRKEVTVVLTGEGSDELFAGYLTYKADRYHAAARRLPAALRKAACSCARCLPVSDEKIGFEYKLKRFWQGSLLSPERAHVFWNGTFSEAEKRQLFRFADARPIAELLAGMGNGAGLQRYLDFDQRYYLPDDILYKVDRMSMAHSLEVRPPFLDPRVVDFANRLPGHYKLRGSKSKYVLRRLMSQKLPASVLRRPKIGFDIPIHEWFRGVLRPLLLDTLSPDAVSSSKLFHAPFVEYLVREHLERRANFGYHLWGLMTLLIWMKRWSIEAPEETRITNPLLHALTEVGSLS
jgi:asparagine synthase (glutamine-hydrolysing)